MARRFESEGISVALCRLMVEDFMHKTGRFPEWCNYQEAYSDADLKEGIAFAKWLIEMRYKKEPFYGYDLKNFIRWALVELKK